jgi:hypothetical protein
MHAFKRLEDCMPLGPQPAEQRLQQAKRHGIKTVMDFRMPGNRLALHGTLGGQN